jgi:aminoglycoside phosphotransferase family enzyme
VAPSPAPAAREVGVEAELRFLASPAAYPDRTASVESIETHFSWVFLTDRFAYKLKRRVRADGLDFALPGARRRNAEAECRLNRRLAADVYLGIVPLTWTAGRGLAIGGDGVAVDWLVKMRRLPADRMLDRRLLRGDWHFADIAALADRLARFFAAAPRIDLPPPAYVARLRRECRLADSAFARTGSPALRTAARDVARRLAGYIARRSGLLRARPIVEGHGDLRPEHIALGSTPRIIDCLEFAAALRRLDPAEELAFLALECARLGAPGIERVLFAHYRRRTGDRPPPELIAFYKALSALVRARIAIAHLAETEVREPAKWPARAAEYLAIAARQCRHIA